MDIVFKGNMPKYQELYLYFSESINNGALKEGMKMPSKRQLAIDLNISLNTIMNAYEMLKDEGYIYSIEKEGYFVSKQKIITKKIDNTLKKDINENEYLYDFTTKKIKDFNIKSFNKMLKDNIQVNDYLNKTSPFGLDLLKEAIMLHLKNNRQINISTQNIIITSGMEGLSNILDLIDIDYIFLENPGYHKIKYITNKKVKYIKLDNKGVLVPSEKGILYTTSFNQFPTGIKMTIDRKKELIEYAINTSSYIIEDDFDTEFRINSNPVTPILKLNQTNVIFFSSFSTTMFPGLRVAYIILPDDLMKLYKEKYIHYSNPVPSLIQLSLASYIDSGEYARGCNKIKRLYLKRRNLIINELNKYDIFTVDEKKNYISLLVKLKIKLDILDLIDYLSKNKINIQSLSNYDINKENSDILVLGYTNIAEEEISNSIKSLYDKIIEYKSLKRGC